MATRPSASTSTASHNPTARYLQARIDLLTSTLIKRMEAILSTSLDEDDNPIPSVTSTANAQLQVNVETQALIRAAEDIMLLTRSMKEVWLFGGLGTVKEGEVAEREEKEKSILKREREEVERGLRKWVAKGEWAKKTEAAGEEGEEGD